MVIYESSSTNSALFISEGLNQFRGKLLSNKATWKKKHKGIIYFVLNCRKMRANQQIQVQTQNNTQLIRFGLFSTE